MRPQQACDGLVRGIAKPSQTNEREDCVAGRVGLRCDCDDQLDLNLLPDERTCWKVSIGLVGIAPLHPSVWRTEDCQLQFPPSRRADYLG